MDKTKFIDKKPSSSLSSIARASSLSVPTSSTLTSSATPIKPLRETAKLKWNMLLQPSATRPSAAVNTSATSQVYTSTSSQSQQPITMTSASTSSTSQVSASQPMGIDNGSEPIQVTKKASIESTLSTSSTTSSSASNIESLRSSLGLDWKVVGNPTGEAPVSIHSRERALSLLERASTSTLVEQQNSETSIKSAISAPRAASIFSPFEYGFDLKLSDDFLRRSVTEGVPSRTRSPYASIDSEPAEYGYQPSRMTGFQNPRTIRHQTPSPAPSIPTHSYHHMPNYPSQSFSPLPGRRSSAPHRPDHYDPMMCEPSEYYYPYDPYHFQSASSPISYHSMPYPPSPYHQAYHRISQTPPPPTSTHMSSRYESYEEQEYQSKEQMSEFSFQMSSYHGPLYAVEFKAGRTEVFYVLEGPDGKPIFKVSSGDLVIVEADRGEDLGKVTTSVSIERLKQIMAISADLDENEEVSFDVKASVEPEFAALLHAKEIIPKRIYRIATLHDLKLLHAKGQEEAIAMVRCQSRIRQKKLPMEVVDTEYQWDRNKLTFYFQADRRIDFRELVRDLFRIYKTRIWMCAVDKNRLAHLAEMQKERNAEEMAAVLAAAAEADHAEQIDD